MLRQKMCRCSIEAMSHVHTLLTLSAGAVLIPVTQSYRQNKNELQ